jgi:hypothetical protein
MIISLIEKIKNKYKTWQDQRFLKANGCESWKQYYRQRDPDHNPRASIVKDYYWKYKYVHQITSNPTHYAYKLLYDYGPAGYRYGWHEMQEWCETNLEHKWRHDWLRVYQQTGLGLNGEEDTNWHICDLGGTGDYIFFAFMHEEDAFKFALRWGQ